MFNSKYAQIHSKCIYSHRNILAGGKIRSKIIKMFYDEHVKFNVQFQITWMWGYKQGAGENTRRMSLIERTKCLSIHIQMIIAISKIYLVLIGI